MRAIIPKRSAFVLYLDHVDEHGEDRSAKRSHSKRHSYLTLIEWTIVLEAADRRRYANRI